MILRRWAWCLLLALPALACSPETVRISESDVLPPRELLHACGQDPDALFIAQSEEEQFLQQAWYQAYQSVLGFSDPAMSERIFLTDLSLPGKELHVSWYTFNSWIYLPFSLSISLSDEELENEDLLVARLESALDKDDYRPLIAQDVSLFLTSATRFFETSCKGTFSPPDCPHVEKNEQGLFYLHEGLDDSGQPIQAAMDLFTFEVFCGDAIP